MMVQATTTQAPARRGGVPRAALILAPWSGWRAGSSGPTGRGTTPGRPPSSCRSANWSPRPSAGASRSARSRPRPGSFTW